MDEQCMELNKKLLRLQWLLQRTRIQSHTGRGPIADPTRGQGRVLAILKLQPEITTKDLGYLLGIRQQSLNELLNKLEKSGYVTRVPSEADKRVMVVTLTEKGKNEEQSRAEIPGVFDCLSEDEQNTFGEYLDRIIASLEVQLGSEDREDMEMWMQAARSRIGDEGFERLFSAWGGRHPHWGRGPRGEHFAHGFGSMHGFGCGYGAEGASDCHGHHPFEEHPDKNAHSSSETDQKPEPAGEGGNM